jgi:hypothetical protein
VAPTAHPLSKYHGHVKPSDFSGLFDQLQRTFSLVGQNLHYLSIPAEYRKKQEFVHFERIYEHAQHQTFGPIECISGSVRRPPIFPSECIEQCCQQQPFHCFEGICEPDNTKLCPV